MSYQVYRHTSLGQTLQEVLDDFVASNQVTSHLAFRILSQFDKSIHHALKTRVRTNLSFRAEHLKSYRFCDNVWTLIFEDIEFRNVADTIKVDKLKIVAIDGRSVINALEY